MEVRGGQGSSKVLAPALLLWLSSQWRLAFFRANRQLSGHAGGETMNEEQAREIAIQQLDEFEGLLAAKG